VRVIAIIAILMLLVMPGLVLAHGGHGGGGGEGASGGGTSGGGASGGGASSSGGGASSGEGSSGGDSVGSPQLYYGPKAPQTRRLGTYFLTPQQVYTWDSFKSCSTPGIVLERLNTDGSFSFTAGESTLNAQRMKDCMHKRGFRFP